VADTTIAPVPVPSAALTRLQSNCAALVTQAKAITVSSDADLEIAAAHRQRLRDAISGFESLLRPGIKEADALHSRLLADLNAYVGPLKSADTVIKSRQDEYQTSLIRAREAEARRIAAQAEADRMEALERARLEADILGDAEELAEVEERMAAPSQPAPLPVMFRAPQIAGLSSRKVGVYELVNVYKIDPQFLYTAILAELETKGGCEWLDKKIKAAIKTYGSKVVEIVGEGSITYDSKVSTGSRSARGTV